MRNRVTLRNSQPYCNSWAWMAEEPPGTTVGNLKKNIASLEASLAAVQRYLAYHISLLHLLYLWREWPFGAPTSK